jgi:hypothetical protein
MLRTVMSVQDIYAYAEPIIQMLREEYGSYDADALDEVLVEDPFVHRLQARGYEVLVQPEADVAADVPAAPRPTPVRRRPAATDSAADEPRPATRTRRTAAAASTAEEGATDGASTRRSTTGTGRTATPRRTTRTPRASSNGDNGEA